MKIKTHSVSTLVMMTLISGLLGSPSSFGHCDSIEGPVVSDARLAFKSNDVTPTLKWVRKSDENKIRKSFNEAVTARKDPKLKEKAEMRFFETLVRIHRAGEGERFESIKPAGSPIEPGIEDADQALKTGSVDSLANQLTQKAALGIRKRFELVSERSKQMNESVELGREYVKAYVDYIHYIERLDKVISGPLMHEHNH